MNERQQIECRKFDLIYSQKSNKFRHQFLDYYNSKLVREDL